MINKYPKITIVTPSYNQGQFLEDTILSVLGQNYPNLEYIVMDGGSSDNSVDILKKYDNELSYWESQKDKGQSDAINRGFTRSTGDILMWLNSDDMLMPNVLKFIAQTFLENGDCLYFGNCIHFRENTYLWSTGSNLVETSLRNRIKDLAYIIQPSSFWTKKIWLEIGSLNENLHYTFDWEWFIRVSDAGYSFKALSKPLSIYRYHEDHKSGTGGAARQNEVLSILEKYSPRLSQLYSYLINSPDVSNSNSLRLKIYKLYCRVIRRKYSDADILRFLEPEKYKKYTVEEIWKMKSML